MSRSFLPTIALSFAMAATSSGAFAANSPNMSIPSDDLPKISTVTCEEGDVYKYVRFMPVKPSEVAGQLAIPMYACDTQEHYTYNCPQTLQAWTLAQSPQGGKKYYKSAWEYADSIVDNCPIEVTAKELQTWILTHDRP